MAVHIRLSRAGAKKSPFYKIVAADSRSPRDGKFIERLGHYNPMLPRDHAERISLDADRIKHWLSVGAKASLRVMKMMSEAGIADKPEIPAQTKKSQPKAKAQERMKALAEKEKTKAEAAAEAAAVKESPAAEVVKEEAPAEDASEEAKAE